MSAILLSAHVIVAILAVGPIAVAASMFPRHARDGSAVASVLTQAWVLVSIALTVATRLAMTTGIFNVLWVVVTVLMIVRPGSTTGV